MDINTYKNLGFYLGVALIVMPVAVYVIQLIVDGIKNEEKRTIISSIPGGLSPDQQQILKNLDKKSGLWSYVNTFVLGITLITGFILFLSNNKVQDKIEGDVGNINNRQIDSDKKEDKFEQEASKRIDYLSERIKGKSPRTLTESQREAFKSLYSLSGEKICLIKVGSEQETEDFFRKIYESIHSFDSNIYIVSIGHWNTMGGSGSQITSDDHNQIQIYDPEGENGNFYKAIKETGLPISNIYSVPFSCRAAKYALVVGKNE